ncbi:DUF4850 domain-containing protein [Solilutibacter silvestris]|uniref:DUF4850 domain-containing protein n=1 Tax=Solilutibacter silvestris TaxID=1645665 RepID=A0A2K1PYK1_9GAMM|nr:DUF4850 domain-containing protein [Lysobacter silvestris]PNS07872.1 hypothetical protein Lysil_2048 [Lysobacter silvestris]
MSATAKLALALSLALTCVPASAEVYRFTIARKAPAASDVPKTTPIGELVVNGALHLPAYAITVVDGIDGWTTAKPESMKVDGAKLTATQAARLAAYATPSGWMLVPRDWKLLKGGVGADGSTAISFVPSSGNGHLDFYDASACRGCAETPASLFFPEARADAQRDEYPVYERSATPLKLTRHGKHRMLYRTVVDGQPIDGIAYYDSASDLPYRNHEVSLPAAQRDLATPMLNWYVPRSKEE